MKKIYNLLLIFLFLPLALHAQVTVLQPPTVHEKKEVYRILKEYQKFMQAQGDSVLPKEKKALATLKFNKELFNNEVEVYVDLDSAATGEDAFMKIFPYASKFAERYPQTVTTSISVIGLGKVTFDKLRNYHFIEATAKKKIEWYRVQPKVFNSPLQSADSLAVKDSIVYDTITYGFSRNLTFHIRFDKVNNVSKNFKLFAVSKAGGKPKLPPLPPLVIWWLDMDPEWKSFFKTKLKLDDYPTSYEIQRVAGFQELDVSNLKFKNLEPLSKMHYLRKLKIVNTPVTSLEGISELDKLEELDISKTQITSLKGIEKMTNLLELKCSGLKLESIEPLRNLTNLVKLDFSENDVEDISPIKDLINLKELDFSLNIKVKTIEPIKDLINLEKLSFGKINAQNLNPLKNLVNLIYLNCYNVNITTLEPIRNHQKIIFLGLDHNKLTTLEPIKDYKFLTHLMLSSTNIVDFSPIKNYRFLRELNIANNPQITDLGPIHRLEYIKVLKCFYTKVSKEEVARFKKNHPDCQITYYY